MSPTSHIIASAAISSVFAVMTQSWGGALACFLSGILIDIDHHFDLWIYKKKIIFHIKHIYNFCEKERKGKLYIIFHSYEFLLILWLCIFVFHLNKIYLGLAIGLTTHLFFDQIVNTVKPLTYFLTYRLKNNFSKESIYPAKIIEQME